MLGGAVGDTFAATVIDPMTDFFVNNTIAKWVLMTQDTYGPSLTLESNVRYALFQLVSTVDSQAALLSLNNSTY